MVRLPPSIYSQVQKNIISICQNHVKMLLLLFFIHVQVSYLLGKITIFHLGINQQLCSPVKRCWVSLSLLERKGQTQMFGEKPCCESNVEDQGQLMDGGTVKISTSNVEDQDVCSTCNFNDEGLNQATNNFYVYQRLETRDFLFHQQSVSMSLVISLPVFDVHSYELTTNPRYCHHAQLWGPPPESPSFEQFCKNGCEPR